jgi:AhpD family alkylhydroperoxidase
MKNKPESSLQAMEEHLPELMQAFHNLHAEATKGGALSAQVKELLCLAVSVALRCERCIRSHAQRAIKMGISKKEILEAAGVAILMAGGPAVASTSVLCEVLDEGDESDS